MTGISKDSFLCRWCGYNHFGISNTRECPKCKTLRHVIENHQHAYTAILRLLGIEEIKTYQKFGKGICDHMGLHKPIGGWDKDLNSFENKFGPIKESEKTWSYKKGKWINTESEK